MQEDGGEDGDEDGGGVDDGEGVGDGGEADGSGVEDEMKGRNQAKAGKTAPLLAREHPPFAAQDHGQAQGSGGNRQPPEGDLVTG